MLRQPSALFVSALLGIALLENTSAKVVVTAVHDTHEVAFEDDENLLVPPLA